MTRRVDPGDAGTEGQFRRSSHKDSFSAGTTMFSPHRRAVIRIAIATAAIAVLALPATAQRLGQISDFHVTRLGDYAMDDFGTVAYFVSSVDPLGTNPDGTLQVFRMSLPGGSLQQVTTLEGGVEGIDADRIGTTILFASSADPLGTNPDRNQELFLADGQGGSLVQLTSHPAGEAGVERLALAGAAGHALFVSDGDLTGQNASGNFQLFIIGIDGTGLLQLTPTSASGDPQHIAISDDGSRVVFAGTTEQLTQSASGMNEAPRISPNGEYVAFFSTSPWFTSLGLRDAYRLKLATDELQLASAGIAWKSVSLRENLPLDIDDAGNVAFYSFEDLLHRNPDLSLELWLAEFDAAPSFEVGVDSPTVLGWDPYPWALSYDVIRGDLSALAPGSGNTVDLGDVVCVEDVSIDAATIGNEDTLQPLPGQGFFYLYRGSPGDLAGPGSWGRARALPSACRLVGVAPADLDPEA